MWLVFDWQAAVVVDDDGQIIDDLKHNGFLSPRDIVQRIQSMKNDNLTPEAHELSTRFPDAKLRQRHEFGNPIPDFPEPTKEQNLRFDEALILETTLEIQGESGHPDRRMEHLLRLSDELRSSQITLENRCIEWIGDVFPYAESASSRTDFLRKVAGCETIESFCSTFDVEVPTHDVPQKEWNIMAATANQAVKEKGDVDRIEHALRELSNQYLPSVSLLLGPLLAARMCVEAHGRERLSKLPSGTIQVLGAEKAFFHHLKTGSPPPKHGHIFMHPWISHSPKWVRGKISRMLAAKVSIAAKIDAFEGESWTEEDLEKITRRVEAIRNTRRKPKRKR
jgi:nucleolar protein 56